MFNMNDFFNANFLKLIFPLQLQILVSRKDSGNLMNDNNTDEMLKMDRFIVNNVTISDGFKFFTYRNICGVYCNDSNDIVLTFIKVYYLFTIIK